jgi:dTDP-4-amino-4,6-dideoxygalactose transaminase
MELIPFNKPFLTGKETDYMADALRQGKLSGGGPYEAKCHEWLENHMQANKALLTHSCTAALEMAALLANIQAGDEVIMPSYTFVSTANAFVLRGGIPVFVDIRPDTLNLDETLIESAITPRTKAIVVVHYAGVACEMDTIMEIANRYGLLVIEDAAQALMATYKGRPLGSIGHLAALSFHDTKNIICGEGGALIINDERFADRAEIIREKGTNRRRFLRGQVDKYSWVDVGSSFLPGELTAAFLWAQLQEAKQITERRLAIWQYYDDALRSELSGTGIELPVVQTESDHNAHIYYLLLPDEEARQRTIQRLKERHVQTVFHYLPLHDSEFGKFNSTAHGDIKVTNSIASRLMRLPLWIGLEEHQDKVIESIKQCVLGQNL